MAPGPTMGLIGALIFIGGALTGALVGAAFTARQAREEPRGGTGDNGTRNEAQYRPPPPPGDLRDFEDAGVEGGGGEEDRNNMMILIVMLAIEALIDNGDDDVQDWIRVQNSYSS